MREDLRNVGQLKAPKINPGLISAATEMKWSSPICGTSAEILDN